jgi:hypothetical protein
MIAWKDPENFYDMDAIRDQKIDNIFEAIGKIENEINNYPKKGKQSFYYRKYKDWLINENYLNRFVFNLMFHLSTKRIPYFCINSNFKGLVKGVLARFSSARYKGDISADVIRVKNNVRAFYVKTIDPFCIKILLSNIRNINNMKTEIETRKRISEYQTVNVPKILEVGIDFDPPFFSEELIWGERPFQEEDSKLITEVFCPQIWNTYLKHGIIEKKINDIIDPIEFFNRIVLAIDKIPWRERYGEKEKFLLKTEDLVHDNGFVQCSLGHGDISIGNLIINAEKEVYLVDWEQASERPIVFDLYEIITEFPESRKYLKEKIENVRPQDSNINYVTFENQVHLAALLKIRKWCDVYPSSVDTKIPNLEDRIYKAIHSIFHN